MDVKVTFDSCNYSPFLSRYLEIKLRNMGVMPCQVLQVLVNIQPSRLVCSMRADCNTLEFEHDFTVNAKHAIDQVLGKLSKLYQGLRSQGYLPRS
ncbi:hypothetical protein [Pseudobacteriovorax antillogorgiicola]|uniref:Uncharacterized protein n=1 Tax=Pseudobacteriovorax antillogorgiicola TaxID=1513793 RepID=A0A1Y6BQ55_9BACT|nr:hypothetical protein [Pseudobacteriovorax antillogorgiicola]TCS55334.1 hypothetical protein EDD56_10555 [Pseudobacteriovorax antillogorgiicola]SMF14040.1 hypothetical protein SAMN06296036_105269 [Pseudobacteriovorax antillogorgiicola]